MSLKLDVGQAVELKEGFRAAGYTNSDIKRLCEGPILAQVLDVLNGRETISTSQHFIDVDRPPFVPDGLELVSHRYSGPLLWQKDRMEMITQPPRGTPWSNFENVFNYFEYNNGALTANSLDFLLKKPQYIPSVCRNFHKPKFGTTATMFFGTIYRDIESSRLVVRGLNCSPLGDIGSENYFIGPMSWAQCCFAATLKQS